MKQFTKTTTHTTIFKLNFTLITKSPTDSFAHNPSDFYQNNKKGRKNAKRLLNEPKKLQRGHKVKPTRTKKVQKHHQLHFKLNELLNAPVQPIPNLPQRTQRQQTPMLLLKQQVKRQQVFKVMRLMRAKVYLRTPVPPRALLLAQVK